MFVFNIDILIHNGDLLIIMDNIGIMNPMCFLYKTIEFFQIENKVFGEHGAHGYLVQIKHFNLKTLQKERRVY